MVMALQTPGLQAQHERLPAQSSRYIDVPSLPWQPTGFPGVEVKVLMEDPESGLQTVLTRMAPGAVLTDHMHVGVEQTWVLEGNLVDHEGTATAGNFVWRPAGSRHTASAPDGALLLGIFQKPNQFF
jgi:anti-sigma factor ChrR (cupin superfamily)